jgi:hypothetical protein
MRLLMLPLLLAFALAPIVSRPAPAAAQIGGCEFQLGFKTLRDMIPQIAGDCIENEWHNPYNGDGLQRTTRGLMVWRKADNWTAFTDGWTTWINGPFGLQARLNTERFAWESAAPPPSIPADQAGGGGTSGGGGTDPAPTPTPQPNDRPELSLTVPDDPTAGETFTVRLRAEDDEGIDAMWWWVTDTGDNRLRDTHTFDCGGATPCRQTWDVSTTDTGRMTFHARSRDLAGNVSEEVTDEIRVRQAPTPTPTATPTATPST